MQLFDRSVESPANVKYYTSVKTNEQILVNRNKNLSFSIYSLHILGDSKDTANHTTFPIRIRKIKTQICGNFWVTQYINIYPICISIEY